MSAAPLHLGPHRLLLDPLGGVFWPAERLLAVADLHLEKGAAAARRGQLVPPWDTAATLDRLALLLRRWRPAVVALLGDSFHDAQGPSGMSAADLARVAGLAASARLVWISGNHDPQPPAFLPGEVREEWDHAGLHLRHQARPGAAGPELCGHHHPKASVQTRAGRITRPCFIAAPHRLMLPALGAYAGGLDAASPAITRLFPRGGRAFLLGRERLFSFTLAQAREQAADAAPSVQRAGD